MGGTLIKTDIGNGRGWLAPKPAASLRRIDAQLGRLADVNEAGRSPEQANKNRAAWLAYERYLNGGPWAPKAPYALGADQSVHCWGYAVDSDDWYNARAAAVWRANGWRQTALYPGNAAKNEPWHGEYSEHLDNHRNDPAPSGGATIAPPVSEEDDMLMINLTVGARTHKVAIGDGIFRHFLPGDPYEHIMKLERADDQWQPLDISQLPATLWTRGCDLHIWDIRGGEFVILNPLDGSVKSGNMWSAVNALRSTVAQLKVTSEQTAEYLKMLAAMPDKRDS